MRPKYVVKHISWGEVVRRKVHKRDLTAALTFTTPRGRGKRIIRKLKEMRRLANEAGKRGMTDVRVRFIYGSYMFYVHGHQGERRVLCPQCNEVTFIIGVPVIRDDWSGTRVCSKRCRRAYNREKRRREEENKT